MVNMVDKVFVIRFFKKLLRHKSMNTHVVLGFPLGDLALLLVPTKELPPHLTEWFLRAHDAVFQGDGVKLAVLDGELMIG